MTFLDLDLNWSEWFEKWEAMQNCYIPQRLNRFDLMLKLPNLPREMKVQILDLGGGPGSLAFHALKYYPNARIVVADADPVLLVIGKHVAKKITANIQFLQVDIRKGQWWEPYKTKFDLVLSATTLHWLNADNLVKTYRRTFQALKSGGWFLNSDHIADDNPEIQSQNRKLLQDNQKADFDATGADDWDSFFQSLAVQLGQKDLNTIRPETDIWEGTEDGQPKQFHMNTMHDCGFKQIKLHWQDLGEAVIGARKPL
ncbi:MAG: class I SAM-dependent methyltransferase [Planctomycetota bacterium]